MAYEILIVDDVQADAEATASIISELAHVDSHVLTNPAKALNTISKNPKRFPLVLIDFNMPEMDGLTLAREIWKVNPQQLIAIFSGDNNLDAPIKCVGTPIVEFIKKNSPSTKIQKSIQALLNKYSLTNQPQEIVKTLSVNQQIISSLGPEFIGQSDSMAHLAHQILKVSPYDTTTILIRGESGTGKELVAKAIHKNSPRRDGPFIALNMGAINYNLIESELFGHAKGAFTGAIQKRVGAFELANGGTIFLDEIGDLPLDLQVKLLRVLQEREVHPIGSTSTVKIDVRIIAATHVDLASFIETGKFRFDLYQRLNVVTLNIPRLAERKDDISVLAKFFLKRLNSNKVIPPSTMIHLEKYSWPGNVRELENLIQRIEVLIEDREIKPEHLPSEIFTSQSSEASPAIEFAQTYKQFQESLQKLENEYLYYHLAKARSIRDAALNRMEIPVSTLRDRMKTHNITYHTLESNESDNINLTQDKMEEINEERN